MHSEPPFRSVLSQLKNLTQSPKALRIVKIILKIIGLGYLLKRLEVRFGIKDIRFDSRFNLVLGCRMRG
jgi:hypothetical protein